MVGKRSKSLVIVAVAIALALGAALWLWSPVTSVDPAAEIERALKEKKIVIVLPTAAWSLQSRTAKASLLQNARIMSAVEEDKLLFAEIDVTEPSSSLPSVCEVSLKDHKLPLVVFLAPGTVPLVLSGDQFDVSTVASMLEAAIE